MSSETPDSPAAETAEQTQPTFEMRHSAGFAHWLHSTGSSLAFTTYQAGKVFLIGSNTATGKLSIFERSFPRSMGFGVQPFAAPARGVQSLWLSSLYQMWRFENFLEPGEVRDGYDAVFVPVEGRTTGEIDVHDIHPMGADQQPVFVVTRFNCLATLDRVNSFKPIWKPHFIDAIVPEDRCHLNGLAMQDGAPAYVTCVSRTNTAGGWRDQRGTGGIVLDARTNDIVAEGLSMPHSPRLHDGTLYITQAGTGEFGRIDTKTGTFEPMCRLPGFARGIAFVGGKAVIGLSKPRRKGALDGLQISDWLEKQGEEPQCRIVIVDLQSGAVEHQFDLIGAVRELYDVAVLPQVRRPMIVGFKADDIRVMIRPAPFAAYA